MLKKAVIILSGGLDSSTLAYYLHHQGYALVCISFYYGQKQKKELESASIVAKNLQAGHQIIDLTFMQKHLLSSSLVNPDLANPKQEYNKENMMITVVPNRNSMMLSLAWSIACVENANLVAFGAHSGDNHVYADCRPDYVNAMDLALRLGTIDSRRDDLHLEAPFNNFSKTDIVRLGEKLGVPFVNTWSCYDGEKIHCGLCGTCRQRKQAFIDAGVNDPTSYRE